MNSGAFIAFTVLISVALVAVITLFVFRFLARSLGVRELVEGGVLLTESGIEFLKFSGLGKIKVNYSEVASAEMLPFFNGLISIWGFRYGLSVRWILTGNFSGKIVVVRLKGRRVSEYLCFIPKNAPAFVEQLKSRIESNVRPVQGIPPL